MKCSSHVAGVIIFSRYFRLLSRGKHRKMFLGWIILIAVGAVFSAIFIGGLLFKLHKKISLRKKEFLLTSHPTSGAASPELPRLPSIETVEGKKKLGKSKYSQTYIQQLPLRLKSNGRC
jgi:hypothetical protein